MQNNTDRLIASLRSYSGLNATFAQQQSVSSEVRRVLKNMSNGVESAHEEYNHALSSALDANTYSRYKNAAYAQKIIDAFNKRESMRHVLTDFMKKPANEIESLANSIYKLNAFIIHAASNYFIENNIKSTDGNIRSEIDKTLSNDADGKRYQEYLDNELRRIIKFSEQEGLVDQVNLLTDIKREFLREVGIEKEKEFDMSYTPKHMDISLN